ncbi:hypothetical protein [Hyphomicrobium sp. CS1GBMeth3]|uniref:hypothetical protein n=1 Tax=Hyphomicrobium sp. CS1GBMeth3 TaxID=1892845 RepID=UPI000931A70C|nr:hypothetical protein [Hyphomicrobium sp. CS1GBMeth3]
MSQQIYRERVLGNFKAPVAARGKRKPTAYQRRDGNSERHLEVLRQLPCVVTGQRPAGQVHHLKSGPARAERGAGMRATDKWGLPLSEEAHIRGVEKLGSRRELEWFRTNGIADPHGLAAALYAASPNLEQMERIIIAHRNGAPHGLG